MDFVGLHGFAGAPLDLGTLHQVQPSAIPLLPFGQAAARLQGPARLLGYSMGARLALAVALQSPVDQLVLIGGTPGIADDAERSQRQQQDAALADEIEQRGMAWFVDWWGQRPVIQSQQGVAPDLRDAMRQRRLKMSPQAVAQQLRLLGTGSMLPLWDQLPQLQATTLLITGEEDLKFTNIAREMLEHIPNAQHVVVQGSGHACHLEQPTRVNNCIDGWTASTQPPA